MVNVFIVYCSRLTNLWLGSPSKAESNERSKKRSASNFQLHKWRHLLILMCVYPVFNDENKGFRWPEKEDFPLWGSHIKKKKKKKKLVA